MSLKEQQERKLRIMAWKADTRRLNAIKVPHLEFVPDIQRLLWASNEFFTGGVVWERKQGHWHVTQCAPCLSFLRKLSPPEAKFALAQRGYQWEWICPLSKGNAVAVSPTDQEDLSRATNYGARSTTVPVTGGEEVSASNPATAALQH